ncbi:MAG: immunoglobulin domain-containing protein [Verrucomicrobiae bacterium]|nr:immunoglobulin domain-containing protein [Verrucomicrobiae bacterium]
MIVLLLAVMIVVSRATVLVNDTWQDGTRTDPAAPVYSENGTDTDGDGNLESAWFSSSGSALTVPAPSDLRAVQPTTSLSSTTYFTPEGSEVNLVNAGDELKITWVFTPTTVSSANSSQGLPVAVVNTPSGSRLTSDSSPPNAAYAGYAMFMNIGQTLGGSTPFQLMKRAVPGTSSALLSSSGSWTALANGVAGGVHGFDGGTQYTFTMTFTRNASSGLDITATMTGGTYNNTGTGTVAFTDTTPNSFAFDTFAMRPSGSASTAAQWDTSLFKVELITANTAPAIDTDPQSQTVLVGQSATFYVLTSGTAPLSYQWYYNNNTPTLLAGATNSTVTLTNLQTTNADNYFVVVTNSFGSVTSAVATLTVNIPNPPSIITQPQDQYISPGGSAIFSVLAGGSEPLSYQWYYNTNTVLTNATDATLTIANVQTGNAGSYSVTISNLAGGITSSNAFLTLNTTPVAPAFSSQPASQIVLVGGIASFNAMANGTAPISYQWNKNGVPIAGATSTALNVTNVQAGDSGSSYTVTASNSVSSVTSSVAILTVTTTVPVANSAYNLTGFAQGTTGGGVIPETDPAYAKVTNALDLATAVLAYNKTGGIKVIEIMTNLDLGWNEIGAAVQNLASTPFTAAATPQLHPRLLTTGVSKMDIKYKNGGLTIFSANGATIRHCTFNIKSTHNVIVRNLKFDEMWEWDEASKGNYDKNDWDFIDIGNGGAVSNVWVDHCTFTKSYDGILDTKAGSSGITISWCRYIGDDGATNTNSWVRQEINFMEQSPGSYPFYNFLRTHGYSVEDIVTIIQAHDKTHLSGQNDLDPNNATITMTFHHLWLGVWDRCVPRLRAGNVHDYNIYVDDTLVLAAKRLRDTRAAALSTANQNTLNNTYSFNPPINGSISTEGGALLVEKSVYIDCLWPLRNNQTDPSNPAYTGKIKSLDSIYQFDGTVVRGNSTDVGSPMGPFQAPIIAFSWNLPGNQLPYAYTPDDPAQLQAIVTSATAGAGAGVLTWGKTNWLKTTYSATAPFIVAQPQNTTNTTGQSVTFTVVVGGTGPLAYQWYFNTNTPVASGTNSALTINNLQTTNAGSYSVVVTNAAGSVTSSNAFLAVSSGAPAKPQVAGIIFSNGIVSLTISGDAGPDYIVQASTNLVTWQSLFTNHLPVLPFNWSDSNAASFIQRYYRIQLGP